MFYVYYFLSVLQVHGLLSAYTVIQILLPKGFQFENLIDFTAFKHGDSTLLLVPKDSEGRRCGHDSGLEDKPNLLFFDLIKCASPEVPFTGCKTTQVRLYANS